MTGPSSIQAKKIYLVTGANVGLGYEATRQLALKDDTQKVYLACRTESKALQAIEDLSKTHGIDSNKLQYIHFDALNSKEDIMKPIVDTLQSASNNGDNTIKFHGLILNAGGPGHDKTGVPKGPNHILESFQMNLMGHIHLVEGLKSRGYFIPNQTVIVYAGSEVARGVPSMGAFAAKMPDTIEDYKNMIEGKTWSKKGNYDSIYVYGHVKGVAALYWSAWARRHPEYHVLTVSPGATEGTQAANSESLSPLLKVMFPIMFKLFGVFGRSHSLQVGAKRYTDAVTGVGDYKSYPSGSFIASLHGASGKVGDQTKVRKQLGAQYGVISKQETAYKVLSTYY